MKNAVVLWTGGKDSFLAMLLAREFGFKILGLVTFVPPGNKEFQAHPQSEMQEQADKLGLRLQFIEIKEPFKQSYIDALKNLKDFSGIDTVVTGDIDLVAGQPNWIVDCCSGIQVAVFQPLWKKDRELIMNEILNRGIKVRVTLINHPAIPEVWKGRLIDQDFVNDMKNLAESSGIDLAGENGEYHTMVIPSFL